jgi:hypothetical protein
MSVLRSVGPARLALWGILATLLFSFLVPTGGGAPSALPSELEAATTSGCPGASIPTSYTGGVTVDGGPLNSTAAGGVTLLDNYSTDQRTVNRSTGVTVALTCELEEGTTISAANGSFSLRLTLPSTRCTPSDCISTTGWYGPLGVAPAAPLPAGYEVVSEENGTSLSVALVAELGGLALDPPATTQVLSTGAPETFAVRATDAVGAPSPLTPKIAWNLTGTGWSFEGPGSGLNVTVEALPGAGAGQLTVAASARVGANRFEAGPVLVNLVSVATTFTGGDANRTDVDAGGSVSFTADGVGAPGYTYTAVVAPGLGLAPVDWSCASTPSGGDTASLACNGTVTYPSPGTADPIVHLGDTFSVGDGSLPAVTVAPPPAISFTPGSPGGYVGRPISVEVSAIPGSGTSPYARACLAPGDGTLLCSASPGPNWTFEPTYTTPGNFTALAWAIDREGTNTSNSFTVHVRAPLSLLPIGMPASIFADAAVTLSSHIYGGALPLRYWWNVSGVATPIATGTLDVDGPFTVSWVPLVPGSADLSLAGVDALGTLVTTSTTVDVGPAVASVLAEVAIPGADPVVAGVPVVVAWQAEDLQGVGVPEYSAVGAVRVVGINSTGPDPVWVNASGVGALVEGAVGAFAIPASAWNLGRLALTVAATHAGTYEAQLAGPGLLDQTVRVDVTVVADLDDLHLFDPTVALAGARENRTLWRIADEYGNPALGAAVDVLFQNGGTSNESIVPATPAGNGTTGVWVDYTARSAAGGTLEVTETNPARTVLLGPIAIPAASTGSPLLSPPVVTLATVAPVGAIGLGLTAWAQRRKHAAAARDDGTDEADLRRLVEGRDRIVSLVRDARAIDLAGLESTWGDAPAPRELPDWLASLVADGTLGARTGPDGVARFCLIASPEGPPLVFVDVDALDRVAAARREMTEEFDPESEPRD